MPMQSTSVRQKQERFLASPHFAVVGQCSGRPATKVLGWYQDKHMDVLLVHPRGKKSGGSRTLPSICSLPSPSTTALSIATVPSVTLSLLEQARELAIPTIWIQPGASDQKVARYIEANNLSERVIWGGPCIVREGDDIVWGQWFDEIHGDSNN